MMLQSDIQKEIKKSLYSFLILHLPRRINYWYKDIHTNSKFKRLKSSREMRFMEDISVP